MFTTALTQIMEIMTGPMIQSLEKRLEHNEVLIEELKKKKEELKTKKQKTNKSINTEV